MKKPALKLDVCGVCGTTLLTEDNSHNGWPLAGGDCCEQCYAFVISARLDRIERLRKKEPGTFACSEIPKLRAPKHLPEQTSDC
jgi:hypothetical protein